MPDYVYALYDFHPEEKDEIALRAGDRIEVIQKDDAWGNDDWLEVIQKDDAWGNDDWLEGKNTDGRIGLFPKSYVTLRKPVPEYVYVTYNFHPEDLYAGDLIEVIHKHDNNWLWGKKLNGTLGLFPQNHTVPVPQSPEYVYAIYDFDPQEEDEIRLHVGERVEVIQKHDDWWRGRKLDGTLGLFPPSYTVPAPPNPEYIYAIYNCEPEEEDEIRLYAGERIEVIQKNDDQWWRGKNSNGEFGLFPQNYTSAASHNSVQSESDSSASYVQHIPRKFISKL